MGNFSDVNVHRTTTVTPVIERTDKQPQLINAAPLFCKPAKICTVQHIARNKCDFIGFHSGLW